MVKPFGDFVVLVALRFYALPRGKQTRIVGLSTEACCCIVFPFIVPKAEDQTEASADQKGASPDELGDEFEDDFDDDDFEDP